MDDDNEYEDTNENGDYNIDLLIKSTTTDNPQSSKLKSFTHKIQKEVNENKYNPMVHIRRMERKKAMEKSKIIEKTTDSEFTKKWSMPDPFYNDWSTVE